MVSAITEMTSYSIKMNNDSSSVHRYLEAKQKLKDMMEGIACNELISCLPSFYCHFSTLQPCATYCESVLIMGHVPYREGKEFRPPSHPIVLSISSFFPSWPRTLLPIRHSLPVVMVHRRRCLSAAGVVENEGGLGPRCFPLKSACEEVAIAEEAWKAWGWCYRLL